MDKSKNTSKSKISNSNKKQMNSKYDDLPVYKWLQIKPHFWHEQYDNICLLNLWSVCLGTKGLISFFSYLYLALELIYFSIVFDESTLFFDSIRFFLCFSLSIMNFLPTLNAET